MMIRKTLKFLLIFSFICQLLMGDQHHSLEQDLSKKYLRIKMQEMFPHEKIDFDIQNQQIIIYQFPADSFVCENIRSYLENLTGSSNIVFDHSYSAHQLSYLDSALETSNQAIALEPAVTPPPLIEEGEWLPELNPFFPTLLAQPHIIGYSAGYRSYDKVFKIACLPVSIGDQFSLYEFKNLRFGRLFLVLKHAFGQSLKLKQNP